MERDIFQKMESVKLFWHWGYMPEIDVKLFNPGGVSSAKIEITDIDVLGLKVNNRLTEERIAADCKTAKRTSPINRAFWLYGLMTYLDINKGYLILSRTAELDHKLAANKLNIVITNDQEFELYKDKLTNNNKLNDMAIANPEIWNKYFTNANTFKEISNIWGYRKYRYWQDSHQKQIRHILVETRKASRKMSQKNSIISAFLSDILALFSHSLSVMVAELFENHLILNTKTELDIALKSYIYDGRDTYEQINFLVQRIMSLRTTFQDPYSKDAGVVPESLALPNWEQFIQLIRSLIENPGEFTKVPLVFKYIQFEKILNNSNVSVKDVLNVSTTTLKQAFDILKYFSVACEVPQFISEPIQSNLEELILQVNKENI